MTTAQLRPLDADDVEAAVDRDAQSFGTRDDDAREARHRADVARGVLFGLDVDGRVMAHCRLLPTEHVFGGHPVRCLDIGGVAVAPPDRGHGHARRLMELVARRGAEEGYGLSLLFPATTRLYRSLGWEHAGSHARYELDARHAPRTGPAMRRADRPGDWEAVARCWQRFASGQAGPVLHRDDTRWQRLAGTAFRYVLDDEAAPGELAAYALIDHTRQPGDWRYQLAVRDWAATTPTGVQALVGFCGSHGSVASAMRMVAGVPDQLSPWLPEQDLRLRSDFWWMARALDLRAAVAARGFPSAISVSVTLRVRDGLVPRWDRPLRLDVSGGEGRLIEAQGADVTLDVRAVGPLFTGFRTPDQLALAGLLRGPARAREYLAAAFAGPVPVLYQFF